MDNNFPQNQTNPENNTTASNEIPVTQKQPVEAPAPAEPAPMAEPAVNPVPPVVNPPSTPTAPPPPPQPQYTANPAYQYHAPQQERVYIHTPPAYTPPKKQKTPRARLGIGSVAIAVAICILFSFGAAFGGTYFASALLSNGESDVRFPISGNSKPSVIIQSQENPTKTPSTYTTVAEAVSPTVVEITTESIVTDSYIWGGNYVTSGAGSGVIVSADGMIVTNNHVVSGANSLTVTLNDGTAYPAKVVGADIDTDIAVIKIEAADLPFALVGNSDELRVGDEVIAVGNPLGDFGGTVTNGIISALSREVEIEGVSMTLIQTNAELNPGNSGGGLFNMYGELIGIVNAKSTSTSSGVSVEGIGFAIPITSASTVVSELINYGYVRGRVIIGINYKDIMDSWDAMRYRVSALGVYVTGSIHDEFEVGDRIVAIDDTEITYSSDIKAALRGRKVGETVVVKVVRGGKYTDITITLTEYVPDGVAEKEPVDEETFKDNFEQ